jgi:WD40 repeat protein
MLTTSLEPRTAFVNYSELHVRAAATSKRNGYLLAVDDSGHNGMLRLYSGTKEVKTAPLPQTTHGSQVQRLHYNDKEDHFIAIYQSREARVIANDLVMHDAGVVNTEQLSILSSVWLEQRQELVTSGGDGSLRYFALKRHYAVTTTGRRLLSRLLPRMTVRMQANESGWMRHLCCDESERRLFAAAENTIIVWSVQTGEQLQRLTELHEMAIIHLT